MSRNKTIAIAVALIIPIAVVVALLLRHPQKPVRHRPAPQPTEFVGVGIAIRINTRTHEVVVMQAVPNSPASEAGITNNLIIAKVDDVPLEGMALTNCVNLIRGPVGTTVKLELVTPDHSQTNTVELTRRKMKL
jgi:C-terminal processing protease CtpA/Prc